MPLFRIIGFDAFFMDEAGDEWQIFGVSEDYLEVKEQVEAIEEGFADV